MKTKISLIAVGVITAGLTAIAQYNSVQHNLPEKTNHSPMKQNANTFINPKGLFNAAKNGFSHVGIVSKNAQLVFISGQWASDSTENLVAEDFAEQVKQTISNLKIALGAAGLTDKDIIKMTVYIADYTPEKKMLLLRAAAPMLTLQIFPASVIVPVPVIAAHPKSLIEIEVIATKE
ncbi:MAG: RidA family protein [Bacteroidia bacterium]